ncbi:MAG: LLM class flavin-dependent oxidoreductase [Gammaproteobacteria bacterium]|nr:LLM class flavin-dependent oxidoreductase [Gammaproteobacteria bacterium]
MEFGVCVATKIDDVGIVPYAENLGFRHAWVADSQMIWSDCYAYMALAAQQTQTINIGTGVAVIGTRIAPVTAHSIATINRLAPGRTFLGIGTGNTAQRLMGQRPIKYKEFDEYIRVVRALLDGGEVEYTYRGDTYPIKFLMPELGFIDVETHIPIHISGFYGRTMELAGEIGDGLVVSVPPQHDFVARARNSALRGAERVGRALPEPFPISSLTAAVILEKGEDFTSDRVIQDCGPFVMSSVHYMYDKLKENGGEPPPHMRSFWKEYCAMVETESPERRHMRVHAGHCTYLLKEEAKFVTPELIRTTCLAGRAEEVIEQVRVMGEGGLDQLFILPSLEGQYRNYEDFSRKVMAKL